MHFCYAVFSVCMSVPKIKNKTATKFICSPFIRSSTTANICVRIENHLFDSQKHRNRECNYRFSIRLTPRALTAAAQHFICLDVEVVTKTDQKTSTPNGYAAPTQNLYHFYCCTKMAKSLDNNNNKRNDKTESYTTLH